MKAQPKPPLWLTKPVQNRLENYGMRRAIAVLRHEAKILRKEGFALQPAALMRVARALSASIKHADPSSEAESLGWAERTAAAWPEQEPKA